VELAKQGFYGKRPLTHFCPRITKQDSVDWAPECPKVKN